MYYEIRKFISMWRTSTTNCPVLHPVMLDLVNRLENAMNLVTHGHDVTFYGSAPQQVVADRAATAGVMCYPCDPVMFTEGYGTAVLEAYCAGVEVVTTDADAFGEVYGKLFDLMPRRRIKEETVPRVLAAIERAVKNVPTTPGQELALHTELLARLNMHSWKRVGEQWCELIEQAIKKPETVCV